MKLNRKVISAFLFASITVGLIGLDANAATIVPKATSVAATTTTNTAKLTWRAFPAGKVTSIKVSAVSGSTKILKTLAAKATSYTFTNLKAKTSYTFSVTGLLRTKTSVAVTVRASTKKVRYYNSIFFGQPQDMVVGDEDQALFALPNGGQTTFSTTTPTKCTITNESFLHAVAMGQCLVVASNPGDADYLPADDEIRSVVITAPIASLDKTLLWSDEFTGAAGAGPSSSNWTSTLGDGCNSSAGCGWGNGEAEAYAACASKLDGNGNMVITASTPVGDPTCTSNKTWTSAKFTSLGKKHFTYGYFEARMKMPSGGGTWPAFWTLGSNIGTISWPRCGELDIMEYAGNNPGRTTSAVHYANSGGAHEYKSGQLETNTVLADSYHTYGMLWLPSEVTFTFDGRPVKTVKKSDTGLTYWPFGPSANGTPPKQYVIFNLAMGGNYGGSIESSLTKATFTIDYVRYYSVSGFGSSPTN